MELEGRVAVVTGAASGIGFAVARAACLAGMRVVLADIEAQPLADAAATLSNQGADVLPVITDVSSEGSVAALRDAAVAHYGAVHLVHNNAGVGVGGPVWTVPIPDWQWVMGVNLWGVIHGVRTFVPLLIAQGEGHVVNTASVAGLISPAFLAPYNVSKHGVVTLSETLWADLRATGSPVGVSVLCPGFVRTRIHEAARNRPSWAPGDEQHDLATTIGPLVAGGMEPDAVAAQVLDAVRAGRFYILPSPESAPAAAARARAIVDGVAPYQVPMR